MTEFEKPSAPAGGRSPQVVKSLLATMVPAAVVVVIGWFTGAHYFAYRASMSVAAFLFFPFLVVGILLVIGLFAAFAVPGEVVLLPVLGVYLFKPYYRWLSRRRHPVFWGSWVGVLLGAVVLFGLNYWVILPGDAATAETLLRLETAIENVYDERKRYPEADENGHLRFAELNGVDVPVIDGVVVDGFGRPFEYEMEGRWRAARYRLRSYGYNGKPGGRDDLCLSHATRLARAAEFAAGVRDLLSPEEEGRIDRLTRSWDDIQSLRCGD